MATATPKTPAKPAEESLSELAEAYAKQELKFAIQRHKDVRVGEAVDALIKLKEAGL